MLECPSVLRQKVHLQLNSSVIQFFLVTTQSQGTCGIVDPFDASGLERADSTTIQGRADHDPGGDGNHLQVHMKVIEAASS
jgi:hypothetical protein